MKFAVVSLRQAPKDLPSRVPDLASIAEREGFLWYEYNAGESYGGVLPNVSSSDSKKHLSLPGVSFDTVQAGRFPKIKIISLFDIEGMSALLPIFRISRGLGAEIQLYNILYGDHNGQS